MAKIKTKILSRSVAKAMANRKRERIEEPDAVPLPRYLPRAKTASELVYDVIDRCSCRGYRFTDTECGLPIIALEDVEDKGDGLFVVRFRCEPRMIHEAYFYGMAKDVCAEVRSDMHFIHETRTAEYGENGQFKLKYEECVWVIQREEISPSNVA